MKAASGEAAELQMLRAAWFMARTQPLANGF
jgi:hypothetical protein